MEAFIEFQTLYRFIDAATPSMTTTVVVMSNFVTLNSHVSPIFRLV